MDIKPVIKDEKIIKIEDKAEKKIISDQIVELIKISKEPDLTLSISHPETKTLTIIFEKNDSIPKKKNFF